MRRRKGWGVGLAVGLLAAAGVGGWLLWQPRAAAPDWAAEYDLTAAPPEQLGPGTVVGDGPPAGWSHLVIKSLPRVHPAHRDKVAGLVVTSAAWMFTAFAADVKPEEGVSPPRHRFRAIGLGLGTRVNGADTVVTPETAGRYGVRLDPLITGPILEKGYEVQRRAVVVLRGHTLALMDTPVWFRVGSKNKPVRYRYALLVDAPTGRLDPLLWRLDAAGEVGGGAEVVWLHPNTIDESALIPDTDLFFAGLPKPGEGEALFGVEGLPTGRARLTLPPGLNELAAKTRFTADEAHALEVGLRRLIAGP